MKTYIFRKDEGGREKVRQANTEAEAWENLAFEISYEEDIDTDNVNPNRFADENYREGWYLAHVRE